MEKIQTVLKIHNIRWIDLVSVNLRRHDQIVCQVLRSIMQLFWHTKCCKHHWTWICFHLEKAALKQPNKKQRKNTTWKARSSLSLKKIISPHCNNSVGMAQNIPQDLSPYLWFSGTALYFFLSLAHSLVKQSCVKHSCPL